ncbi:MAG: hypothetical protein AB7U18_25450 [Dehalococcoidia bacterium]
MPRPLQSAVRRTPSSPAGAIARTGFGEAMADVRPAGPPDSLRPPYADGHLRHRRLTASSSISAHVGGPRDRAPTERSMQDLLFFLLTFGFFALAALAIRALERL